jgi:hypothetical protein
MAKFIGAFLQFFKNSTWVDRDLCPLFSGLLRSPTCLFHLSNRFQCRLATSGVTTVPYHRLITTKCVLLLLAGLFYFNVCDKMIT